MRFLKTVTTVCLFVLMWTAVAEAGKQDKPSTECDSARIVDVKLNLVPHVTGGFVVGKAADLLGRYSNDATGKFLYGCGVSLGYYLSPKTALSLSLEYAIKPMPGDDDDLGRGLFYSAGLIYNFQTTVREIPYARLETGLLSASHPRDGGDLNLETIPFLRGGLGFFTFTTGAVNLRFELYYLHAFTEGTTVDDLGDYYVDFFARCVGLEIGIGIPLSKRH